MSRPYFIEMPLAFSVGKGPGIMKLHKKTAIALGVFLLLALASGGYWFFKGPSEEEKKELTLELISYIEQDKPDKVRKFIEEYPELVDHQQTDGKTPLHLALEMQRTTIVKLLIESGATTKEEPLLLAAIHAMLDGVHIQAWSEEDRKEYGGLFELIIEKDKKAIHMKDEDGNTPLHLAAFKGASDIVSLMLSHGADVYAENEEGINPLHAAVIRGDAATVKQIADSDPELIAVSNEYKSLLILAVENGRNELYGYLLEKAPESISFTNEHGKTAMDIAEDYHDEEALKLFKQN